MRSVTTALTFSICFLGALLWPPAARADQPLDVKDIEVEADVDWSPMTTDNATLKQLQITLTFRGPIAARATAYGDPVIDSILNDSGQPVTQRPFVYRHVEMRTINRGFSDHPKDGLKVRIHDYISPPIKKFGELRGSIDLRTGGRIEKIVFSNALKRPDGVFDEESLKSLGLVVRVQNKNPRDRSEPTTMAPLFDPSALLPPTKPAIPPGPEPFAFATSMPERWLITIERAKSEADGVSPVGKEQSAVSTVPPLARGAETPAISRCEVVECDLVDFQGKRLDWRTSGSLESGDTLLVGLGYDKRLPDDAQLKLVVHLDPEVVSVPFELNDIPVPPQRGGKGSHSVSITPMTPLVRSIPSRPSTPNTVAPISPGVSTPVAADRATPESGVSTDSGGKPSLSSALKNALGASMGLSGSSDAIVLSPDTEPRTPPRAPNELHVDRKSGNCALASRDEPDGAVEVDVGEKLKGTCRFYLSDFFDKQIINAPVFLRNKSTETMHCYYYVAFFDKDGKLLGCASQGAELAGGDQTQLGSCLIFLPDGARQRAVSYQVVYYESDMPIGTPGGPAAPAELP
ncbi:MAG TPA: hypothetical protein DD670_20505 [Planctomycetaceae bacterium]|nr:hypothetical protein [Planctomycetaceae bacterium]